MKPYVEIPEIEFVEDNNNLLLLSNAEVMNLSADQKIDYALMSQGLRVKTEHIIKGYSTDTFLVSVPPSTNINRIFKYELNIASILGKQSVRIHRGLIPYEGGVYIGVEVPSDNREYPNNPSVGAGKIPIGKS